MSSARLKYLINASIHQTASNEELEELAYLCQLPEYGDASRLYMEEAFDLSKDLTDLSGQSAERIRQNILSADNDRRIRLAFITKRLAVAAVLLLLAGTGVFIYYRNDSHKTIAANRSVSVQGLITPGGNKATLKMDDGTVIVLDSVANGQIDASGIKVVKLRDGQLSYVAAQTTPAEATGYSTISTPRGGQYMVELPDGSTAWLNAASSIRFPNSFDKRERRVSIKGEVYFEVAKAASPELRSIPFIVNSNDNQINVLGTHFNIMAYPEEKAMQTTLLEGSVTVAPNGRSPVLLKPGQQINVVASGTYSLEKPEDPERVIAWKNGRFELDGDIQGIMRQISRWYDVDVKYEGNVTDKKFGGAISRSENVTEVLKMLELTENIKFRVENKTIIVSP